MHSVGEYVVRLQKCVFREHGFRSLNIETYSSDVDVELMRHLISRILSGIVL